MDNKEFITKNAQETEKLGGTLARKVTPIQGSTLDERKKALVVGLEGELGSGKTTFIKGFAKALGIKEKISSPTFVLIKSYKIGKHKFLIHIDAYRLKDHQDLISLGIKDILNDADNIVLIEWSDRVKKILPKEYLKIHIDHIEKNERKITFQLSL